jgi:single-strand DNA-binding protein
MIKVQAVGIVKGEPKSGITKGDMKWAMFTLLAKNQGEKQYQYVTCSAFGQVADVITNYCTDGKWVSVAGNFSTGSYTNDKGYKVYSTKVIVQDLGLIGIENATIPSEGGEKAEIDLEAVNSGQMPF